MFDIGQHVRRSREKQPGNRTQKEIALAAGVNHSAVSLLESNKHVRFETLRAVCRGGLKMNDDDWQMARWLWLENQSGERVFKPAATHARAALELRESRAGDDFLEKAAQALVNSLPILDRENLHAAVLQFLSEPKALIGLRKYLDLCQSFSESAKTAKPRH